MTIAIAHPVIDSDRRTAAFRSASILSTETAVPQLSMPQSEASERLACAWGLCGADLDRWRRISKGTRIEHRQATVLPEEVVHAGTAERMSRYEQAAPDLAAVAAKRALDASGVATRAVTDLITVSCTGFTAPGVDVSIVDRLHLNPSIRRTHIGFMGCFGGVTGLRSAVSICLADPEAVAMVLCVELCSLHFRPKPTAEDMVASALFGDGAAAAIVAGSGAIRRDRAPDLGVRCGLGGSYLLSQHRNAMTWRITDAGFAMTLDPALAGLLKTAAPEVLAGVAGAGDGRLLVHPGGPRVLRAVADACRVRADWIAPSWSILRRHGNMSSATILFVLREALRRGIEGTGSLIAFGPGLSVEWSPISILRPAVDEFPAGGI